MWGGAGCPSGWIELTAYRTLALRDAVGRSPDGALTLLLLKLVNDTFRTSSSAGNCLEASVPHVYMSAHASDLKDSVAAKLVDERHAGWGADLSLGDDAALLDYLTSLDQRGRLSLLAHCLSFGINALHEKVNAYGAGIPASALTRRMAQAHLLAQAADLDMDEAGWEPTIDTYLNRVRKGRRHEAVREAKGEGTGQLLDHLKKGEMATEAERQLKSSSWLLEVLGRSDLASLDSGEGQGASEGVSDTEQAEEANFLAFLTADLASDEASRMASEWSRPFEGEKLTLSQIKFNNINMMDAKLRAKDKESCLRSPNTVYVTAPVARSGCFMSHEGHDMANLLDIAEACNAGRFAHHIVDESAAVG
ncbi:hypothetical protein FIU85_20995 (plasmid) [Roseovarius sp. THAF8]|nr:hypothetical protein FIU85_20995 [Roseovarius sp. THAF8]